LRNLAPGLHFFPNWNDELEAMMKKTLLLAAILAGFIGVAAPVSVAQADVAV